MTRRLRSSTKSERDAALLKSEVDTEAASAVIEAMVEPVKKKAKIKKENSDADGVADSKAPEPIEIPQDFLDKHVDEFKVGLKEILEVDPTLSQYVLIKEFPLFLKDRPRADDLHDKFTRLASAIISQQLSNSAARSIREKFINLYDGHFPDYKVLKVDIKIPSKHEQIFKCGLSRKKCEYLESLANYFADNEEYIRNLFQDKGKDQKIMDELVSNVKGIGPWSAKMFLMTGLYRMDVFAPDDVGIARGCAKYLSQHPDTLKKLMKNRREIKKSKIKHKKLNWKVYDEDIVDSLALLFSPNRTIFSFIIWRMASTDIDAIIKTETDFTSSRGGGSGL